MRHGSLGKNDIFHISVFAFLISIQTRATFVCLFRSSHILRARINLTVGLNILNVHLDFTTNMLVLLAPKRRLTVNIVGAL